VAVPRPARRRAARFWTYVVAALRAVEPEVGADAHALLRELLTRCVELRPAGETEWLPSTFISGPKHLPVTYRTA